MNESLIHNYDKVGNQWGVNKRVIPWVLLDSNLSEIPTLDDLKTKLFAVHATDYFPVDWILRCHADWWGGVDEKYGKWVKVPSFAPTLHFSLWELVRPHSNGSWDDNKYAIVAPLWSLVPQLVNVMPYDTFTLWDIDLKNNGFFILVPDGENIPKNWMNVIRYNKLDWLRKAVDDFIIESWWWGIKMNNTASIDGIAIFKGIDINNPRFFSALLNANRKIWFWTHAFSILWEWFRFAFISQIIHALTSNFLGRNGSNYCSLNELKLQLRFIEWNLEKLDKYVSESGFPELAKRDYLRTRNESEKWVSLLKLEVIFRENHGVSLVDFLRHNKDELQFLYNHPWDIEVCEKYYFSKSWCNHKSQDRGADIGNYFIWLASFEEWEFKDFIKGNSILFSEYSEPEILLNYYFFRYLEISSTQENIEKVVQLIKIIEVIWPGLIDKYKERFRRIIRQMLSLDSNKYTTILNLLNRDETRRFFWFSNFVWEFTSIEDIASVSPEVVKIKSQIDPVINWNELNYLKKLWFIDRYFELAMGINPVNHRSYEDYYFGLMEIKVAVDVINRFVSQMSLPINQKDSLSEGLWWNMNIYEYLHNYFWWKIEELFEGAGYGELYRKNFQSEDEFWNSWLSLLEILENES